MKKFLLMPIFGLLMISCTVDPIETELQESMFLEANVTSNPGVVGCAGADKARWIEISEASAIESWDEVRKLYISMLDSGVSRNGTFEPSIWDLIDQFHVQGLGDLTTTYTIANSECSDSVSLTVTVVPDGYQEPTCEVSAGEDNSITITKSEADALESWDEVRKLYLSLLSTGVSRIGEFDPTIWDLINSYSGIGEYPTTYTVGEGDCKDSAILTVKVVADFQEPACEITAGSDNSVTLTVSQADALESWDEVRKLYLSLLDTEIPRNGTFDPSIWDLINSYSGIGEYSTIYTVGEGDCTDSVELTVKVVVDEQESPVCIDVTAGPDNSRTILESQAAAIESWDEVRKMYLNLLAPGVDRNGTFDPTIWDLINDFQARRTGDFTTTYTVTKGECSDTVALTITVIPD